MVPTLIAADMSEKLDGLVVAKAVNALLAYEEKKSSQEKNGKSILMAGYSKPILAQVLRFY